MRAERVSANLTTYRIDCVIGWLRDFHSIRRGESRCSPRNSRSRYRRARSSDPQLRNLSMSATHPHYYAAIINADPAGLSARRAVSRIQRRAQSNGASRQSPHPDDAPRHTRGGTSHSAAALTGGVQYVDALSALAPIKDVSIVAIPGSHRRHRAVRPARALLEPLGPLRDLRSAAGRGPLRHPGPAVVTRRTRMASALSITHASRWRR